MGKNTALRVVDEIADPLEVAEREVAQVEAEKIEISAKRQELLSKKAADDAIVAAGDHRKVDDAFLDRGLRIERGIIAMDRALEVAETRRVAAEDRAAAIRRVRAEAKATADVAAASEGLEKADGVTAAAVAALIAACSARDVRVQAAVNANAVASQYGLAVTTVRSTFDLLAALAAPAGIHIGPVGHVRPFRIA